MKFLSAYYFRAHMYTIVPRHIREDMQWMADVGTDAVVIGVLEQDLTAAVENIEIIAHEAARVGIQLWVTPSRWGSLVAGCPKVPSIFSSCDSEVWSRKEDGTPHLFMGPIASVHHPRTLEFFVESLECLFKIAPVGGIIWDEPKALERKDYSPAAREALRDQDIEDVNVHINAQAGFFDKVNAEALKIQPDLRTAMFLYGHLTGYAVECCSRIPHLDEFGLDGRPYRLADGGGNDSGTTMAKKTLIDHGPRFRDLAHANGKGAYMLIENHALATPDIDLMDKRLPEVLALGFEHVCYYYYPRSVGEPERAMEVLGKHLQSKRA